MSDRPLSASELSDTCDASLPTVYRRIEEIVTCNLVAERNVIDADGNHYNYEAAVEQATVYLDDGEFVVNLDTSEQNDAPERLMRMWSDIREDES